MFYFTYLLNTVNTNSVLNLSIYNDKLIYTIDQGNKKLYDILNYCFHKLKYRSNIPNLEYTKTYLP